MKREPAHTLDNDNEFVTALADGAMVSLREMDSMFHLIFFEIYTRIIIWKTRVFQFHLCQEKTGTEKV